MKAKPASDPPLTANASARDPNNGGPPVESFFAPAAAWLFRVVPAFDSLRTYTWGSLRLDAFAGLTVAAVAVPQAMAYASVANLPPIHGLYTAIVMTVVGALFDSSRQLINGPTNAISIAVFSALAFVPAERRIDAAVLLAFLVGIVQCGITLFRLGDLTRYISPAVIIGFTLGAAVLLFLEQLRNLFGLHAHGDPEDHFLVRFGLTMAHINEMHRPTLLIGLGTILCVLVLRGLGRLLRTRVPDLLVAVGLMAGIVWLFDLEAAGVEVIGNIPSHLPAFAMPEPTWTLLRGLSGSALAIALLGLLEAIAMAKVIAAGTGQKLDMNQQCLSEGLANLVGSFFQCYPGSGSLTRSAINVQAGAVSQWSGVFAAGAVAVVTVSLAPLAYYIPRAALAGILLLSAWHLVDRRQLVGYLRTTRFDAGIVIATALSAVLISVEFCILIGVFLSFLLLVPRTAPLQLTELVVTPERVIRERAASDTGCGRILIFALEGEWFFGSVADLERHAEAILERLNDGVRVVVLRVKRVRNHDAVCLECLERFLLDAQRRGVAVLLCGVRPALYRMFHKCGIEERVGQGRVFRETDVVMSSTLEAVRHAYELIGTDLCQHCPRLGEADREVLYYMI
jgi:SulP family sulfate permease